MSRFVIFLFTAVVLLGMAAVFTLTAVWHQTTTPGPLETEKIVILERGATLYGVAAALEDEGILASRWPFVALALKQDDGRKLKPGEYRFQAGITPAAALALVVSGQVVQHRLTIPEGLTVRQIYKILADNPILAGNLPEPPPAEGTLLPETYFFARGETRLAVIERMKKAMNVVLEDVWRSRDEGLPLPDARTAVVLASIVERESGSADERRLIAGVFYNRLEKKMKLQSDPTVIYGVSKGQGTLDRDLTRADLDADHRWNTYRIDGLPPSPICNPGRAALVAVLHPTKTKALYFVASGDGGHAFAETLNEHNRNVARWRALQQQSSGK